MGSMAQTHAFGRRPCPRCGAAAESPAGPASSCPRCGADLRGVARPDEERTSTSSWVGQVIADRYRVLALLGEGGMGAVFKAEHTRMGKVLALKLLRGSFARDPSAVTRFRAEARIVSRLSHPNTIAVFDFGEIGRKGFYLAMEYVPGKNLSTTLKETGRLPEGRAVGMATQVLGALAEAHEAGVVHRDVKPANIMITERPEGDFAKVLDFGVAKLREWGVHDGIAGGVLGTPSYLAPEQAQGQEVDGRADLYAAGVVLYELVSGRPPFAAASPREVLNAHVLEIPRPLVEVAPWASPGLSQLVARALAKRPQDRFQSAVAMREALLALRSAPPPLLTRAAPEPGRDPPLAFASRADFDALVESVPGKR